MLLCCMDPPSPLEIWRSMEVPPDILEKMLGKKRRDILVALRPALMVWDITEEHTAFFLHHREDLTRVFSFVRGEEATRTLSLKMQWYAQELRRDLRDIVESGALARGIGSHFAIENHPSAFPPIRPKDWHPKTIAFVEQLRPKLVTIIKTRHIDHWLQTPLEILGKLSPIQMIEYGRGDRILALIEEMEFQG